MGEGSRDQVVARLEGRRFTLGEVQDRLDSLPVFARMRHETPERKQEFLEACVLLRILALVGQAEGYRSDPVFIGAIRNDLAEQYLSERVAARMADVVVPEARIREYYDAHPEIYRRPAQTRVAQVLVADRETAVRVRFKADNLTRKPDADPVAVFGDLVKRFSIDASTRGHAGDLGLFPRVLPDPRAVFPQVEAAALGLDAKYQVSEVIEAPDGFHVLFATDRLAAKDLAFEEARPEIGALLRDQAREETRRSLVDEQVALADIRLHEDVIRVLMKKEP
jgi:parvulin-like peptidyl-prolyl isomerase